MSVKCKTSPLGRSVPVDQKKSGKWLLLLLALLFILMGVPGFSQTGDGEMTIKGVVVDSNGARLTGVTVQVVGSKKSTTTNNNGEFELKGIKRNTLLTLSMVGFKAIEVKATEIVSVTLRESITSLDEVVVTGFQKIDRKKFTSKLVVNPASYAIW